jgi:hypothetical protein
MGCGSAEEPEEIRMTDAMKTARLEAIEECAKVADKLAEWFGEHQAFLAEDAVDDCARKIRALAAESK